jgi:PAS domain S-box-containing protein
VPLADGLLVWLHETAPAGGAAASAPRGADAHEQLADAERATRVLERALGLAGVSVWRLDLGTQRIHFNAVGFEIAGLQPDPAGVPLEAMRATIHADDRAAVAQAAEDAIASGRVVDVVARYRNLDGSWRPLLTRRVAERDRQGRVVALAGISLDLSSQWRERERAEALAERARLVAEAIGVGFWSLDAESGRTLWDEQMYRIHRRDPALGPVPLANWIEELVHPEDRAWLTERLRRVNERWEPMTELTFRALSGPEGERWIQSWARRIEREGRRWLFGMHWDVSDRQRAQLHAQRERERTQWAIDAAGVGVWERDAAGHWTYWNEAMYRLRGLEPSDPRTLDELVRGSTHPEDGPRLEALYRRHLEAGVPYRTELRVAAGGGRWRWLMTHGHAVRDPAGRLLGMVGVNLDVTDRKEAEALQHEKARVEQASRDKSAFMARMSHELRTPLNAVLGFTRLLEDDLQEPPTPRQRERLRQVSTAGTRLLAMVDDMLDLAGVEAQAEPPCTVPLVVAELLAEVGLAVQTLAQELRVELRAARPPAALRVLADRPRLLRALTLLLQHALKRSTPGSVVEVEAGAGDDAASPRVVIVIRDGGPGLTPSQHLWLFEGFAPDAGAEEENEATALRLSLARGLLQSMRAQVEAVESAAGGTEIWLELPRAVEAPAALELLAVEDNPVNLQLVRELVGLRPQIRLRTAVDGATGIAAARELAPDVALLDLQLPDMHGIEVMRRMRADPAAARTRFIALSADAMPEHVKTALDAGFDAYWTKPIDFTRFLAELDRLAGEGPPPGPASPRSG